MNKPCHEAASHSIVRRESIERLESIERAILAQEWRQLS
jgi:hypothetical protein